MTGEAMSDLVRRITTPGSFSAKNFSRLANQIRADLTAKVDWDAAYSGCDIEIYLYAFALRASIS
jgi:hypothetical protein